MSTSKKPKKISLQRIGAISLCVDGDRPTDRVCPVVELRGAKSQIKRHWGIDIFWYDNKEYGAPEVKDFYCSRYTKEQRLWAPSPEGLGMFIAGFVRGAGRHYPK